MDSIARYLRALHDPLSARDENAVAALEEQLRAAEDPLERLKLRAALRQAEQPHPGPLEEAFVAEAKAWGEEHGVGPQPFLDEGVPADVLRRAGFSVPRTDGSRGRGRRRTTALRPRISGDAVREAIPKRRQFSLKDIQDASGASSATVRNVVLSAVATGDVLELGPDPKHTGRGRPRTLYKRA